jgi:sialic acid synthase SpsE
VKIGQLDTLAQPVLIAEIGNNHEGSLDTARQLVHAAHAAGARAVKFQTFRTEHYISRRDAARFERLKTFELPPDAFAELADLARGLGLAFLSTPFDLPSVEVLAPLVDAYKIASGDNDFYPLIKAVCAKRKPMIVSTGLASLDHVRSVVRLVRDEWKAIGHDGSLAVLHCVSSYPVAPADANLNAIGTLARELDCEVGYSDHTLGPTACIAAAALGARIIEKHFTLSKTHSEFRDHQLSADPQELAFLVSAISEMPLLLGSGTKEPRPCEVALAPAVRRSIVAAVDLEQGHRLALEDITWVRPLDGLRPGEESLVIGRALKRSVCAGDPIRADLVESR